MISDSEFNLYEHLGELRKRLITAGVSVGALSVISFVLSDFLIALITAPAGEHVYHLYFFSPYEAFMTKLKLSFASGVFLSSPVILTQLWQFVSPGLFPKEKRLVLPFIAASILLFFLGALFAYFLVIPIALGFFLGFQDPALQPLISIGSYLSFFLSFILTFGLVFVLPAVLVGLISLRVVKTESLSCQRKIIILSIFILAAVLTPTADVLTQCLLAFPLWGLFELSLWVGKNIEKRSNRHREEANVGAPFMAPAGPIYGGRDESRPYKTAPPRPPEDGSAFLVADNDE